MSRPIIGLAGGIGSGKSAVADILRDLGCVVSNADAEVRALLEEPEVRSTLVTWWGPSVVAEDGSTDRSFIAGIVFQDADQRRRLEAYLHPLVSRKRRDHWQRLERECEQGTTPPIVAFVIDAPLLFEAGLDAECDAVLFVDAAREVREARVQSNRGWSPGELERRESAQWPLDLKRERSDHTIDNSGDLASLRPRVEEVLDLIVRQHTSRGRVPSSTSRPSC